MYSCTQFYIQSYFDNVVMTYESKYLQDFNYKKYDLHKNGMIFVVEDSFILYCCIEHIERSVSCKIRRATAQRHFCI